MYVSPFGVEHSDISKARKEASTGRLATGGVFRGFHGIAAGKKGKKLRSAGREIGGGLIGSAPGIALLGAGVAAKKPGLIGAGQLAGAAGGIAGGAEATKRTHNKGYYKREK
jgi:hypothetical protein